MARINRSGYEGKVRRFLAQNKVKYRYELRSYKWREKVPNVRCEDCGGAGYATRTYTPDFFLENGVIIEAKGKFTPRDRKIAEAMRDQHPELDIRLLFMRDNYLTSKKVTTYSQWCEKNGILCAVSLNGEVPKEWR